MSSSLSMSENELIAQKVIDTVESQMQIRGDD